MLDCFQMSFTPGPHNHQKASLDIISLLQVWSLLCIAQLSENSLVVRNIFVKNLDDRIKLFVILGPDRWWCCWQSITPGYIHTLPSFPIMNIFRYAPTYWYLWHSSVIFIQVWCFFKRASEYVAYSVTLQSSDFLTRDKISSPNFSSSIFPFSSVSTLAEKMVGMHTLMTILSPIMKISRFFPNCAQSDCQSSAMLPLAPPVGSIQSFFPTIWGQQVW